MRKKSIIFLVMSLLILTFSSSAFAVEANSEFKSESQKFFTMRILHNSVFLEVSAVNTSLNIH